MIVFPGCKINIGLIITEKRADGFHNLESIFYPLKLSDILEILPSETFSFSTSGLSVKGKVSDNLVVKAYYLLAEKFDLPPVKIHLHKIVPMGAGLGGGSADAAATLTVLNEMFHLKIPIGELEKYADSLGSDCAFFIRNHPAYVTGKGENIQPVDLNLGDYYIYLIHPEIHVSTAEAFAGITPRNAPYSLKETIKQPVLSWSNTIANDFEQTIFKNHPEIKRIKKHLYANGAIYASMTGSGSSVYGIFKTVPTRIFPEYVQWISKLEKNA